MGGFRAASNLKGRGAKIHMHSMTGLKEAIAALDRDFRAACRAVIVCIVFSFSGK
jgi:diacylglycerol kinase